jgi:hypothetical protein
LYARDKTTNDIGSIRGSIPEDKEDLKW